MEKEPNCHNAKLRPGGVEDNHPSIPALFSAGNYAVVARDGKPGDWRTHAAFGLIGKLEQAVEGLSHLDSAEARYYTAVAYWIGGDEGAAADALRDLEGDAAASMLDLIRKPTVRVLAQLPWNRRAPHDLLSAAAADPKFEITNISFHPDDVRNRPYADIHEFWSSEEPPDFYTSAMVEWHLIPPNLRELPCPLLGVTSDYDLHIQGLLPWLRIFDSLITTDDPSWRALRGLVECPVSTFPKIFGVRQQPKARRDRLRDIDVFCSGTVIHPYYPDKAAIYHEIIKDERISSMFVNGFLAPVNYNAIMERTKLVLCFLRLSGATSTRALESLNNECATLVQNDSVLLLYLGPEEGVFPYNPERGDLTDVIQSVLGQWDEVEKCAARGAAMIREHFCLERVASQFFRYLAFVASSQGDRAQGSTGQGLVQKRIAVAKSWLPGNKIILRDIVHRHLEQWQQAAQGAPSSLEIIDAVRESTLELAAPWSVQDRGDPTGLMERIAQFYEANLPEHPRSLVMRFNFIRTSLHFGSPAHVSAALDRTARILQAAPDSWDAHPMEDVLSYDFASTFFNYRGYIDVVTGSLISGKNASPELTRLILASLNYYASHYGKEIKQARAAVELDGQFPYYKMRLAKLLASRRGPRDCKTAAAIAGDLIKDSILVLPAGDLLSSLGTRARLNRDEARSLAAHVRQAKRHTIVLEWPAVQKLRPHKPGRGPQRPLSNLAPANVGDLMTYRWKDADPPPPEALGPALAWAKSRIVRSLLYPGWRANLATVLGALATREERR